MPAAPRARGSPSRSRRAGGCSPRARPRRGSARRGRTGASVRLGSAAETTSFASSSVPSASVTPTDASVLRPDGDHLALRCGRRHPERFAADSSAVASAPVPPRANTAVPAAPPSVPAESFRNTAAVPVAHGPIEVYSTPRVASGPRTASSSKTSCTRSATAIGSALIASRPVLAPRSRKAFPSFRPIDRVGDRGRLRVGRRGDVHVGEEARDRAHLRVEAGERVGVVRRCAHATRSRCAPGRPRTSRPSRRAAGRTCARRARSPRSRAARACRSFTTEGRSRPTVCVMPGAVTPSAGDVFRRMPPTRSAASSSVTFLPAFAR